MTMNFTKVFALFCTVAVNGLAGCSDSLSPAASDLAEVSDRAAADSSVGRTADFVFTSGKIYTVNKNQPWAEAVAVRGNEIIFVGDNAGAMNLVGTNTDVIDLHGKMLLPGFVEGHFHSVAGGVLAAGLNLQADDIEEILTRIREHVASTDDDVILGYGVRFNPWGGNLPTAAMLDEIESERPMYFWAIDGHAAWVNSEALKIADVDRDTPDPVPGYSRFARDEEGNPTGWLVELPAQLQVLTKLIDLDRAYIEAGIREWLPRFTAAGITTVHDLGVQGIGQAEGYQIFSDLIDEGVVPIRVQGVYYWNDPTIDPLPPLMEMRENASSDLLSVRYLKVNLDGGDEGWNGLYTFPYLDKPETIPDPIIPYDILFDVVERADAAGINVTCHCFGDLAVRKMLDAIEAAMAANPNRERRNTISHATIVHPDDRARFAKLGVTYDSSGGWMALDPVQLEIAATRLGIDRVNQNYPIKRIADLGGNISLGSDWPASGYSAEYRPLFAIQTAVTRQPIGKPDHPLMGGNEWRLPVGMALWASTLGAAIGMDMDEKVGSLETGKLADLIILDTNLLEVPMHEIHKIKVLLTMMNGKVRYREGI